MELFLEGKLAGEMTTYSIYCHIYVLTCLRGEVLCDELTSLLQSICIRFQKFKSLSLHFSLTHNLYFVWR